MLKGVLFFCFLIRTVEFLVGSEAMEPDKIADEINMLSLSQKLLLVQDIWDSIASEGGNLSMPEWQKNELDKRYRNYKDGDLSLHDWQDVHNELREKHK
jgi:putative addiction module component (TIGR02574 family)